jgi:hypothetical protein
MNPRLVAYTLNDTPTFELAEEEEEEGRSVFQQIQIRLHVHSKPVSFL